MVMDHPTLSEYCGDTEEFYRHLTLAYTRLLIMSSINIAVFGGEKEANVRGLCHLSYNSATKIQSLRIF